MNVKNILVPPGSGGNTGVGAAFAAIGFVKALIFVAPGSSYPATSIAAFKTALALDILNDDPFARAYPVQGLVKPTDQSTKPVEEKFPDGSIAIVNNGFYDLDFQFVKGGWDLSVALQLANGLNRWFFIIDDKAKLWGCDAGGDNIQGINPNLNYAPPVVMNTGSNISVTSIRVNFTTDQLNVNGRFLDFNGAGGGLNYLNGLSGLLNVIISQGAARASGVFKIGATTSDGVVNLHDLYAADLAVVGAFQVLNGTTLDPLTVTAAADDPTHKGWTVTVSTSDANYSAGAGTLLVGLAGPTAINGLIGGGYESNLLPQ